jgi:hypothetical protein
MTKSKSECKTPGFCECPNMTRCPSCGYTQHDKNYYLDHNICDNRKSKTKQKIWTDKEWANYHEADDLKAMGIID